MVSESAPTPYRFSSAEYHHLGAIGFFPPDVRTELLDGEVLVMPPIGDEHAASVDVFTNTWPPLLQGRALVRIQNPVKLLDGSEPVPDCMLLTPRDDFYRVGGVRPEHVVLLIEVSDTTFAFDRGPKLMRYAEAGIPEVWIIDLKGRRLLTFREPRDGEYSQARILGINDRVSPAAFPDIELPVGRFIR